MCEYSHLGYPRREKSLSQPFTAEELLGLYKDLKDNGITLKLFPQKSTPRVIGFVNELYQAGKIELPSFVITKNGQIIKCDINDPWCIWVFLEQHLQTSMANPLEKFSSPLYYALNGNNSNCSGTGFPSSSTTVLNES